MGLADRMKSFEIRSEGPRLLPGIPIAARLDGRAFHTFTKGLDRPFDTNFSTAMIQTAEYLVESFCPLVAYTQSDEISLLWEVGTQEEILFHGRVVKMASTLASAASVRFCELVSELLSGKEMERPTFDARVWNLPSRHEAAEYLLWRELDATKNSISSAASTFYTPKELKGKSSSDRQEMLFQRGINWNDYPIHFKRGTYLVKGEVLKPLPDGIIEKLPEPEKSRRKSDPLVLRREVKKLELPPLPSVSNPVEVFFEGGKYILEE